MANNEVFGWLRIGLVTTKPQETDEEIEARYKEFSDLADKIETLLTSLADFYPEDWRVEKVTWG